VPSPRARVVALAALVAPLLASPAFAEGGLSSSSTDVRYSDANSDRVIISSTAETHPAGTFYFSDYEIVLLQVGYAVTDSLQISFTGVPPLVADQPYFFDLTAKLNVYRGARFRAALQLAGDVITSPNSDPSTIFGARVGAIGQFCFDASCLSSFSVNAGTLLNNKTNTEVPVYLSGGLIIHLTDLVKLMAEPTYAVAVGDGKVDGPSGFILNYGLRLSGKQFGFDLAFVRPIGSGTGFLVMGVPLLSFTYRG
jgi:hypothetical protein